MRWSSVFAAVGLVVVAVGISAILLPFVFTFCTGTGPIVCSPGPVSSTLGLEAVFVGLAVIGVGIIVALQELRPIPERGSERREGL